MNAAESLAGRVRLNIAGKLWQISLRKRKLNEAELGDQLRTSWLACAAAAIALWSEGAAHAQEVILSDEHADDGAELTLAITEHGAVRYTPAPADLNSEPGPRGLELSLTAGGDSSFGIAIAQRASLAADANGDLALAGRGSELRLGRFVVRDREQGGRALYMFVASDNEALTWQPGVRNDFGGPSQGLALEHRAEIGDVSAGVTYARDGVQASLAYVDREASTRVGRQSFSQDDSFAGFTLTMRR